MLELEGVTVGRTHAVSPPWRDQTHPGAAIPGVVTHLQKEQVRGRLPLCDRPGRHKRGQPGTAPEMFVPRHPVGERAGSLGHTLGTGLTGIAPAARLGDDGAPPGSVHNGLEDFVTLSLPRGVIRLGHGRDSPGAQHPLVHRTGEGDRRIALGQRPQHGADGTSGLSEAFPGAAKLHWHRQQRYAQRAELVVVSRVSGRALLSVGALGRPHLGELRNLLQNGGNMHGNTS